MKGILQVEQGFTFDLAEKRRWFETHWHWSLVAAALYVVFVHYGQQAMRKREAFSLRPYLIAWNAGLAIFSILGSTYVLPELLQTVRDEGIRASYCSFGNPTREISYWTWLFALSKLTELADTVFLVLRKRPVVFLHWYHHATVLVLTWYVSQFVTSSLRLCMSMNFFVHSLMYSYYALRAYGCPLSRYSAMTITTVQIMQMVVGSFISFVVFWETHFGNPETCVHDPKAVTFQLIVYVTYLILFIGFFKESYLSKKPKGQKEKKLS